MHRTDGAGATADNKHTGGDPQAGTEATVVTADWLNDVQENIAAVIEAAGIALTKGRAEDLLDAIRTLASDVAVLEVAHRTSGGENGGTLTGGAWRTRPLEQRGADGIDGASVGSNQVILPAGTYDVEGWQLCNGVNSSAGRLQNVTADVTLVEGATGNSTGPGSSDVVHALLPIGGRFTVDAAQALELQIYGSQTQADIGLGGGLSGDSLGNVFAYARFKRVS